MSFYKRLGNILLQKLCRNWYPSQDQYLIYKKTLIFSVFSSWQNRISWNCQQGLEISSLKKYPSKIYEKSTYRIVASRNTFHYSGNLVWRGVSIQDMLLNEKCFYSESKQILHHNVQVICPIARVVPSQLAPGEVEWLILFGLNCLDST